MSHLTDGPPCRNMEQMLQQVADGSATGWRRYYAVAHAARCHRCGTFLERVRVSVTTLRESKEAATESDAIARLREKISSLEGSKAELPGN